MTTQFFIDWDGDLLARVRNNGSAVPELFDETTRSWYEYPALDPHTTRPIPEGDALKRATLQELHSR